MASYSQKDVRIKVDDVDLFCDSATIKYRASITPKTDVLERNIFSFAATKSVEGTFDISYPLTGADPIAAKIYKEKTPVSLSFGGLTASSGYLTSYSFDCRPFSLVSISASFSFYNGLSGTFSADSSTITGIEPLTVSDMSLDNGTLVGSSNIKSIKYGYKVEVSPIYVVQDTFDISGVVPEGINTQNKRVDVSFGLNNYDLSLPVTGVNESFTFNFKDKNNVSKQSYYVDGQVTNKTVGARVGDLTTSDYTLNQGKPGGAKTTNISTLTPTVGGPGSTTLLVGNGFDNARMGYIGEYECKISGSVGELGEYQTINIVVNPEIISGYEAPVGIATDNGFHRSNVTYRADGGLTF